MKITFCILIVVFFVTAGCKKPVTEPNSGIYRGSFYKIYDNGDTAGEGVATLALTKQGQSFQLNGDTATGAPLSCAGTYVIENSAEMTFNDNSNPYYGYDPNNLLNNTYNYNFDDHLFNLTLKVDTSNYQYNLIRN